MIESEFHISAMDCPSEEQLVRGALTSLDGIERLEFRLPDRTLRVWHHCDTAEVTARIQNLSLGGTLVSTREAEEGATLPAQESEQGAVLRFLLAVNLVMFVAELVAGWYGESAGLLSDALDMLADAMVYGIALWAVGGGEKGQRIAVRVSGWLQLVLGLAVLVEVARRALLGSAPEPPVMVSMASLALVANVVCLLVLARHRGHGIHMRASWIFSANDVIANTGVMAAAGLVYWTRSSWPDLVIGTAIGLIVIRGAQRILRLGREPR